MKKRFTRKEAIMKVFAAALGWIIAVVAIIVLAFRFGAVEKVAPTKDRSPNAASAALGKMEAEVAQLKEENEALKQKVSELKTAEKNTPDSALEENEEGEGLESDADTGDDEKEGPNQGERVMRAQLGAIIDMTYGPLFTDFGLEGELKDTVREWFIDAGTTAQGSVIKAFRSGDVPAKDVKAAEDQATAELTKQLATVLSADELAAWEAYEDDADYYMFENILKGQLTMLASGLTDENRAAVGQVMAEELAAHIETLGTSDEMYTLGNFNQAQSQALAASMERLAEVLDEEQYGHAEGFVQIAEQSFSAMGE
jgi:cell division protein FtsB